MLIKIDHGTPLHDGESLCHSCHHARVTRGRRLEEELVICSAATLTTVQVRFKVTSCTDYSDNREPSYQELAQKAWILRPATKRRAAGFVRMSDLEAEEYARFFRDPAD